MDEALRERTGDHRFDILVNNAGIGQIVTLEETTEESFDEVMNINIKAPLFVTQQALPRLKDGGRIINISSFVTRVASPSVFAYSMSKGAIDTLTHILAQQLGSRNITVNAIQPGIINTEMNDETLKDPNGQKFAAGLSTFKRWGESEDVADIAAFLASSDSRWVIGQLKAFQSSLLLFLQKIDISLTFFSFTFECLLYSSFDALNPFTGLNFTVRLLSALISNLINPGSLAR